MLQWISVCREFSKNIAEQVMLLPLKPFNCIGKLLCGVGTSYEYLVLLKNRVLNASK